MASESSVTQSENSQNVGSNSEIAHAIPPMQPATTKSKMEENPTTTPSKAMNTTCGTVNGTESAQKTAVEAEKEDLVNALGCLTQLN